jgi:hypothetical protein
MQSLNEAKEGLTVPTPFSKPGTKLENLRYAYSAIQDSVKAFKEKFEDVNLGKGLKKFQKLLDDNAYSLFETNKAMMTDTMNLLGQGIRSMSRITMTGLSIQTGIKNGLRLVDDLLLE